MPKIVVVDVANTLYRAFFALPPLRAPDGFPSNAVLGFANMLGKVLREEAPDAVVMAQDPPGPSFRKERYSEYKAGRDAQPEDLTVQFPVARELIDAMGIPVVEVAGFEADDVIASLVKQTDEDTEVVIVSSDKDLMQLVDERVVLLDTMKDRRIGPAEVEARFGVPPSKLLDVRALVGDSSDNIPGVKGIGEKGAAKLINEWGDLERLLANAGDVKAKRQREALQNLADDARLSKELATLRDDVALPFDPAELPAPAPDESVLLALYERLGFTRLLEELRQGGAPGAAAEPASEVGVEILADTASLSAFLDAVPAGEAVAILCVAERAECGLPGEMGGLAIAARDEGAGFVPLAHPGELELPAVLEALAPLLSGPAARPWLARDTKRVQTLFAEAGIELPLPRFDVELGAFLLDPAAVRGTPALAERHLGRRLGAWEDLAGRGAKAKAPADLPLADLAAWAAAEVCALRALEAPLRERLEADEISALLDDVELPLTAVLSAMERRGVRIDESALVALSEEYEKELSRIEGRIYSLAGEEFTVNSPKQLQKILFEKLKLPPVKKTKTGFSTDESVLEQLSVQHELPAEILAWRRLSKLKSTYVDALPPLVQERTGRLHPIFHQTGAATGRLSSSNPNVQNIPIRTEEGIRIREAFIPAEGSVLVSADYSQLELRILAHYSGDENLLEAFHTGDDIHRRTAAEVAGIDQADVSPEQRAAAKAINFGIIYGSSAFGIANQLGIAQAEAQQTIDAYFARYEGVRRFLDDTMAAAKEQGFVTTLLGRRRYLPDLASRNRVLRQAAERMAVNTVIQGTEADLVKKAMVEVEQALTDLGSGARMILQVHDELVFEVPESAVDASLPLIRERMESVYALDVPLVVEAGAARNWREAH
ncbi:MAG: DNA polymerase I [Myxococcota bacterium]|nr:DNA polymerase I [Myxococcota bacterium]